MTEWFEEWFGEEYLHLYPHRDEADAERIVALMVDTLAWRKGWRVLDVGCGAGRHSRALARAGAQPVGLDLSMSLLRRAREETSAPLVRADMRWLPVRPGSMDLTVSLFTSFGYFAADAEHAAALRGMAGTLRPGGWFTIDYLNAEDVRANLVRTETLTVGDREFAVERRLSQDGAYVIKTIHPPSGRKFIERVRLFSPRELETMLEQAGIRVRHRFGGYDGAPPSNGARRCILMGARA